MATQNAAQAATESLTAGIRVVNGGVHMINVTMIALSFRALGIASDFLGMFVESVLGAAASEIIDTRVQNSDIAYDLRGCVHLTGWLANVASRIGVRLSSTNLSGGQRIGPTVMLGHVRQLNVAGLTQYGAVIDTGADALGALCPKLIGCSFTTASASAASAGISLQGTGLGAMVDNCSCEAFPIGMEVGALQANARGSNLTIKGSTTATSDLSGTAIFPNPQVFA
jgi:hypothetical protein